MLTLGAFADFMTVMNRLNDNKSINKTKAPGRSLIGSPRSSFLRPTACRLPRLRFQSRRSGDSFASFGPVPGNLPLIRSTPPSLPPGWPTFEPKTRLVLWIVDGGETITTPRFLPQRPTEGRPREVMRTRMSVRVRTWGVLFFNL